MKVSQEQLNRLRERRSKEAFRPRRSLTSERHRWLQPLLLVLGILFVVTFVADMSSLSRGKTTMKFLSVPEEIQLLERDLAGGSRYTAPNALFSIVQPTGWRVQTGEDVKPYDVTFFSPNSISVSLSAARVDYNDLPALFADMIKREREFGVQSKIQTFYLHGMPAARREVRMVRSTAVVIDFVTNHVAHQIFCTIPVECFDQYLPTLMKLVDTYQPRQPPGIPTQHPAPEASFRERIQPVKPGTGFRMDGYFVWCGSAIKAEGAYHLFAARWPVSTGFPEGYRKYSEIVRASSATPEGPYVFQEVVIGRRASGKWDSGMAHNPAIHRVGDKYVLFYIGSDIGSTYRQIGYASAAAITGPWTRSDQPLDLGCATDANNPAACFDPDGSLKMFWRTKDLHVCISTATSYAGPYQLINSNVWPAARLEDFFFFKRHGQWQIICEDNAGSVTGHERWGAHLWSADGLHNWQPLSPASAYDHTIRWMDGTAFHPVRRERPWLLVEDGKATHLFTAVFDGTNTWNQPVPLQPPYPVDQ